MNPITLQPTVKSATTHEVAQAFLEQQVKRGGGWMSRKHRRQLRKKLVGQLQHELPQVHLNATKHEVAVAKLALGRAVGRKAKAEAQVEAEAIIADQYAYFGEHLLFRRIGLVH